MKTSYVPNFHNLSLDDRIKIIGDFCDLESPDRNFLRHLFPEENKDPNLKCYSGFAPNFKINDEDLFIYLETEEASIIPGASYGAKLCYESGGIKSKVISSKAIGQMQFINVKNPEDSINKIIANKEHLLEKANEGHEFCKAYDFEVKAIKCDLGNFLDLKLYMDPGESMGAAAASDMIDSLRHDISKLIDSKHNRGMPSNYCGREVDTELNIPIDKLERRSRITGEKWSGEEVKERILWLDAYAKCDIDRALTNNKGIMNGIIGFAQPLAQDTRAIAAANTSYEPLSSWKADSKYLYGKSRVLIPSGIVGGEVRKDPKASFLLKKIERVKSANDLAEKAASVGLDSNFAALSMNGTIGIKEGHGFHRK
jgi:degradative hydroxymethylglutaryl-CoA reductase